MPEPIIIRFPTGAWEYSLADRVPEIGDTLVRQGKTWAVVLVTGTTGERVVTMAASHADK